MKFNRTALSMALGGAVLPLGIAAANDSAPFPKPLSTTGKISDSSPLVGTSTVSPQHPVLVASKTKQPTYHNASYAAQDAGHGETIMMDDSIQSSSSSCSDGCSSGGCSSGGCDSYCATESCRSFGGRGLGVERYLKCNSGCSLGWFETDALLWWAPNVKTPPLVASGLRGQQATAVLLGGPETTLGGEMLPGIRANFGFWLDDCQSIGAGGRVFGIFYPETFDRYESNGESTLGVPFFNATLGTPDVYNVALDTITTGADSGAIRVESETDFLSADAYGKFLLARSGTARADFIGGYTFARLDDTLEVFTTSTDGITNGTPNGTVTSTLDSFATRNIFHGGHLGFTSDINRGRWTFSTLSKVSIGNMNQQVSVFGVNTSTPPNQQTGTTQGGGLLARNSNSGVQERDVFTFLPEAGAKLRYNLNSRWKFNVGYTFLFLPDVAMAGSLIDPVLDLNNPQVVDVPRPFFEHDCYYLHGLDLGLSFCF